MSNLTVTNIDRGNVILEGGKFRDELLKFAGAGTVVEGTILARKAVVTAAVVAADVGNTGNGTVTLAAAGIGSTIPLPGAYVLRCSAVVTNGGVFDLADPDGVVVASGLSLTVGAGSVTVFIVAGLTFTVTEGSTDFIIGDEFTITFTADGTLTPFVIGGVGGAQTPIAVLTYDVTATGAGDVSMRDMVTGSVRAGRLVIDADGDASNITDAILDQLRDYTLVAIDVQNLSVLDNQ